LSEPLPDGGAVRRRLEAILASGEYDTSAPDEPLIALWTWLGRQIQSLIDALVQLSDASPALYWLVLALCLVVLAAIFVHAGVVLHRALRLARAAPDAGAGVARDARGSPRLILERSRLAAAAGRYVESVRLSHLAAVLGLDQRGLLRFHDSFTSGDYLRQLRGAPGERRALEVLTRVYEPASFGRAPTGSPECDACLRAAEELVSGEVSRP
jgi:hypothetical protein